MSVIFFDPFPPSDEVCQSLGASRCDTLAEVLSKADFVALHCPGSKENRHLIDTERLAQMKPTAYLINTARGDVVDNGALVQALKNRTIAGAGLDVYENEPNLNPAFLELENCVLLPHLGSATEETRGAMGMRVIENVTAFFAGQTPRDKVV
jgi:lactate dehydrogenase-like 2-hydroxyacid dehydrogenase